MGMVRCNGVVCAAAGVTIACGTATAGPEWNEPSNLDAGSLPPTAQVPMKPNPPLTHITGRLDGLGSGGSVPEGAGDFQDMYKFAIETPTAFSAMAFSTDFFPQLFLFAEDGTPLLASAPGMVSTAFIGFESTDGTGVILTSPGVYFLAISGPPSVPIDAMGMELFLFAVPGEVSGPDGSTAPIADWTPPDPAQFGDYEIFLTASKVVPAPGPAAAALIPLAAGLRRRRRPGG